jgi:hypothetical protein
VQQIPGSEIPPGLLRIDVVIRPSGSIPVMSLLDEHGGEITVVSLCTGHVMNVLKKLMHMSSRKLSLC